MACVTGCDGAWYAAPVAECDPTPSAIQRHSVLSDPPLARSPHLRARHRPRVDRRGANPRLMSTHLAWHASVAARHRLCRVARAATGCTVAVCDPTRRPDAPTPLVAPVARPRVDRRGANPQPPCTLGMWCRGFGTIRCGRPPVRQPPRVAHDEPVPRERVRESYGSRVEDAESEGESLQPQLSIRREDCNRGRIAHVPSCRRASNRWQKQVAVPITRARGGRETTDANSMRQSLEGETKELTSSSQCTSTLPETHTFVLGASRRIVRRPSSRRPSSRRPSSRRPSGPTIGGARARESSTCGGDRRRVVWADGPRLSDKGMGKYRPIA